MGKFAKVFLCLLLLNSASSYSQEIKVVRSLGFDGKNVLMVPRGDTSTTASTGCIVLRLHPNSLAYQLGIETAGFVFVRYGHQKLEAGCEDIDEITKSWKDDGRPGELQVADRDGRILNGIVTPAQFRLAQQNLNYAKGNSTDMAAPIARNSGASQSNSATPAGSSAVTSDNALRLMGLDGMDVTDKKGVTACKVVQSYPGTPAANAGIKADDIVVRFDGKSLNGCDDLKRIISATQARKPVPVEVIDLKRRTRQVVQVILTSPQADSSTHLSSAELKNAEITQDDAAVNIAMMVEEIDRKLKALPPPPEYLYETSSFLGAVSSTTSEIFSIVSPTRRQMRQMYDELFLSANEYLNIAKLELIYARRLAKQGGRMDQVDKHIKRYEHFQKLYNYSNQGAIEAYRGNIDAMHAVVEPIYEASKFAAKCLGKATHNPAITRTVNSVFYFTDYWVEASDKGLDEANINLMAQLTTAWMVKSLPMGSPAPGDWSGKTLQVATEDAVKLAFNKVFTTPALREGLESELTTGASCLLMSGEKSSLKKYEIKPALDAIARVVGVTLDTGTMPVSLKSNGNGTVTDNRTKLMWQQEGGKMSWDSAVAYCKRLSLAGYSDWRLPNIEQLKSIIDARKKPTAEGEVQNTLIDKKYFPNAAPFGGGYWSSVADANEPDAAWWLSFADGNSYDDRKNGNLDVRCVRDEQSGSTSEFGGNPNVLITSQSVGPVQIGMTVAQVRKALPKMKLVVSSDGEGADLVEVKDGDTAIMALYPVSDLARPINDRTIIEYMLVCDGRYATKEGVHPGMYLRDVEGTYGKLTNISMSEIESRETAEFARTPAGITLRAGRANYSQAGIYPRGKRQTTQFYPDASVRCISIDTFAKTSEQKDLSIQESFVKQSYLVLKPGLSANDFRFSKDGSIYYKGFPNLASASDFLSHRFSPNCFHSTACIVREGEGLLNYNRSCWAIARTLMKDARRDLIR